MIVSLPVFWVNLAGIAASTDSKRQIFNSLASLESGFIYITIGSVFSFLGETNTFKKSNDVIAIYGIDLINFSICLCVPRHWAQ